MASRGRALAEPESGALHREIWSDDPCAASAAWQMVGQRAAQDGWARRLLSDVTQGKLSLPPEAALPALVELARLQPEAVRALLMDGDSSTRVVAARALGRCGPDFLEDLLSAAKDDEVSARLAGIAGLGEAAGCGTAEAVEGLAQRVDDPHGEVCWAAAVALGQARGRAAVERALVHLDHLVKERDDHLLAAGALSAAALWPLRPRAAAKLLLRFAEPGAAGRRAVAMALEKLPRRAGSGLASTCLGDSDPQVRALCAKALGRWAQEGNRSARRDLERLARDTSAAVRAAAGAVLAADSALGSPGLIALLAHDRAPPVRAAVAGALGKSARPEAADLLQRLAKDRAVGVRAAAVTSLGAMGDQEAIREACRDREPAVRAAAASALEVRGLAEINLLLSLSEGRNADVARAATRTLWRHMLELTGPVWQRLVELARDERTAAAAAEGLAAALDRDPKTALDVFYWWPFRETTASFLWMIARAARTPGLAELARTAGRALEGGEELGEALRDLSSALRFIERPDVAEVLSWLAECADASTLEDVDRVVGAAPPGSFDVVSYVTTAGRLVARGMRARSALVRDRYLARARAVIQVAPTEHGDRAYWPLVSPVLHRWELLLNRLAERAAPSDLRVALVSQHVLAGDHSTLLIELENLGRGCACDLSVDIACPPAASAGERALPAPAVSCLRPGEKVSVVVVRSTEPGSLVVQGQVKFHDVSGHYRKEIRGTVQAFRPKQLSAVANPYVVGKPLAPESAMFFGRQADLAFIERALESGEQGAVVVLVGARRTGKTSLLKRLQARLGYRSLSTFVDVQGMLVEDASAFFLELARQMLSGGTAELMLRHGDRMAFGVGAESVLQVADRLDRRMVLLLDEFDDLEHKVRTGVLGAEVFSQLRHLIQHSRNLSLVLSGTHRLEELAGEHWSFLLNLATYRRIGCLEPSVAEEVIRVPLARLGIICDEAALARVVALGGRHPYFLQLLGYRLVERCVESGEAAVGVDRVEQAADDVVDQGDIHLRYLWESAGPQGQPVLRALAAAAPAPIPGSSGTHAGLTGEELRTSAGLDLARFNQAARALESADLLAERAGRYWLRIGLLSRWLGHRTSPSAIPP